MRNIDPNLLANANGLEPVCIVGIFWDGMLEQLYADKDITFDGGQTIVIKGKILELGSLENVSRIDGKGSATSIEMTLDDTDGTIKAIFNHHMIYMVRVNVYQWFEGVPLANKILLYEGQIVGPLSWRENDRSFNFSAVTIEPRVEIGFSPEEASWITIDQDAVGKAWPMCFGTPIHVPAPRINELPTGMTLDSMGIPDDNLHDLILLKKNDTLRFQADTLHKANALLSDDKNALVTLKNQQLIAERVMQIENPDGYEALRAQNYEDYQTALITARQNNESDTQTYKEQLFELDKEYASLIKTRDEQLGTVRKRIRIQGGYKFPQDRPCVIRIGEVLFNAQFLGGDYIPQDEYESCEVDITWIGYQNGYTWLPSGNQVTILSGRSLLYIVSIVPGTVTNVYAYRSFNGFKKLCPVPREFYEINVLNGMTFIEIPFYLSGRAWLNNLSIAKHLELLEILYNKAQEAGTAAAMPSKIEQVEDWEDDLYVTFQASVGPNICNIIEWIVNTYTYYRVDRESFDHVAALVDKFPANFALFERRLAHDVIKDIAYQSRCEVWLKNGIYYIRYLSEEPTAVDTITDDHVIAESMVVTTTAIEDLVTKYVAQWKPDYSRTDSNLCIVKHNTEIFGVREQQYDYFIYNDYYLVEKSATFWSIRMSNVYKSITMDVVINKLNLETGDCVKLDFNYEYVRGFGGDLNAVISSAKYNSGDQTISLEFWTPIMQGMMSPYPFAYPAGLSVDTYYAPYQAIMAGGTDTYTPGQEYIPNPYTPADNAANEAGTGGAGSGSSGQTDNGKLTTGFTAVTGLASATTDEQAEAIRRDGELRFLYQKTGFPQIVSTDKFQSMYLGQKTNEIIGGTLGGSGSYVDHNVVSGYDAGRSAAEERASINPTYGYETGDSETTTQRAYEASSPRYTGKPSNGYRPVYEDVSKALDNSLPPRADTQTYPNSLGNPSRALVNGDIQPSDAAVKPTRSTPTAAAGDGAALPDFTPIDYAKEVEKTTRQALEEGRELDIPPRNEIDQPLNPVTGEVEDDPEDEVPVASVFLCTVHSKTTATIFKPTGSVNGTITIPGLNGTIDSDVRGVAIENEDGTYNVFIALWG